MVVADYFDLLSGIVANKRRTWAKPREFFISWSGVPTLAYHGFSPVLLDIRREIEEAIPGLRPENPGSRWPKTTLGALRDGRVLSMEEARALRSICDGLMLAVESEEALEISQLSYIVGRQRTLEDRESNRTIRLLASDGTPADDQPPEYHVKMVDGILDEFSCERLEEYLPKLQQDGNRESHYRDDYTVSTLALEIGADQLDCIARFIDEVDRRLPGAYCWFAKESRHLTVRALI